MTIPTRYVVPLLLSFPLITAPNSSKAQSAPMITLSASTPALPATIAATFLCEGGEVVQAVFDNRGRRSVALTLPDRQRLVLPQTRSGSGARYANRDETLVFWNKGNSAVLEKNGKTVLRCEARRRNTRPT